MKRNLRKLTFANYAAVAVCSLLLVGLEFLVDHFYRNTSGLDSFRLRAMLDTARYFLQAVVLFLVPFWKMGVKKGALCSHRKENLLGAQTFGFARFAPVLGVFLLTGVALMAALFVATQAASVTYTFTQPGQEAATYLSAYTDNTADPLAAISQIPMTELLEHLAPALVLAVLIAIPLMYWVWCRIRLAPYLVLDDAPMRAFPAIFRSIKLCKKQTGELMNLDLRFWWYYLLMVVATALGYADIALLALGVTMNGTILFFCALALQIAAHLAIAWCFQPKVELAYAAFYDQRKKAIEKIDN